MTLLFLYQFLNMSRFFALNVPFHWTTTCHAINAVDACHVIFYLVPRSLRHLPRFTDEFREIVLGSSELKMCFDEYNLSEEVIAITFTFDIFYGRTFSTSCIQYTFNDVYLFTSHGFFFEYWISSTGKMPAIRINKIMSKKMFDRFIWTKKMWTRTATRVIQVTNKTEVILIDEFRTHRCGRNRCVERRTKVVRCKFNWNWNMNARARAR